ncbi:MAG: serine/threonine protein kinase [Planctomyces sp.]|nr:serine/threonine protein kinase [Planctomyces sp.]
MALDAIERSPKLKESLRQFDHASLGCGERDILRAGLIEESLPEDHRRQGSNSVVVEIDTLLRPESSEESLDFEPISLDFLETAPHPEMLGRLDRYAIERVIGIGGMGIVLKAYDTELHRVVAIKVLAPQLAHRFTARRRFAREAQAAAAVVHSHVIPIHNVESDGKLPYLVMQYVAGESLQQRVDRLGPLTITETLRIAQQTASGLAAAHAQGLVHRDVKPANILLEDQVERVLLSDFGLARTVDDASLTRTGVVAGTPWYMSPEQALGDSIDHRSDLFSLGCVICFMLTGRPPFPAKNAMAVLNRICHEPHVDIPSVRADLPAEIWNVVCRLLAKDRDSRFGTAMEVEAELAGLLSAHQRGELKPASRGSRKTLWGRVVAHTRTLTKLQWSGMVIIGLCLCCLSLYSGALVRVWLMSLATPSASDATSFVQPAFQYSAIPDPTDGQVNKSPVQAKDRSLTVKELRELIRQYEALTDEQALMAAEIESLEQQLNAYELDSTAPMPEVDPAGMDPFFDGVHSLMTELKMYEQTLFERN